MKNIMCLLLTFIVITSCNPINEKFDQKVWKNKEGIYYGHRVSMVTDLIQNHLYFGMPKDKVKALIGEPSKTDEYTFNKVYLLEEKFGIIDPTGYKYLELEFDKNNELSQWKIIDTGFKE